MNQKLDTLLLHLSLIDHIGPATIEKIVAALTPDDLNQLYCATPKDISSLTSLSQSIALRIAQGLADKKILDQELLLAERHKITWLSIYNPDYPADLKNIYLPPTILYSAGAPLKNHEQAIAFVGSRKADTYGHSVVASLIPELIAHNWTIISGGALGIDSMVHYATLEEQGKTVAVFGSGLLKPYPSQNSALFNKILANGGTLVSSFSLKTAPLAGNFPARNRIIAGLSKACIVVQAAEKSGALITARYALDQGKEVGAVPGAITNPLSSGCHKLIGEGAAIITSARDILNLLGTTSYSAAEKTERLPTLPQITKKYRDLPDVQQKIIELCQQPISFDELLVKTELNLDQLQEELLNLQLEMHITQNFMGQWLSYNG